jgi:flavin-dependent dehydrogenase
MTDTRDVVIVGGGLAGLTLSLQLRQRSPELAIAVLERRRHPVPAAAHKVGESSVEIAAHYFDTVLGLREHLDASQLRKFGFRFFFSDGRRDIDRVTELGPSGFLATPTYQIDRGIFENHLGERALASDIDFRDGAVVRRLQLMSDGAAHEIQFQHAGKSQRLGARWIIDASGRAGLLKRQLGLARSNDHDVNAVWFRINARIDVGAWSADAEWLRRCDPPQRWLSTNHLCGKGYWVWLIPLSSGSHSVGIVADGRTHPLRDLNTFDKALAWLHIHQPRLADELDRHRAQLQDFLLCEHFSHDCAQCFSANRWAMTGDAGVFLDPFYSPGGDFIAIANTYITELILRDRAGEPLAALARLYEQFYRSFYESTLSLFVGQYDLFGQPEVMAVKVIWDYAYYWGVLCQLFFQQRLADVTALGRVRTELMACMQLNFAMQRLLRDWGVCSDPHNPPVLLDQSRLAWFAELNRGLRDPLDVAGFIARLRANSAQLAALAREIVALATARHSLDPRDLLTQADAIAAAPPQPPAAMLFPQVA